MSEDNITQIIIAVISSNFLVEIARYALGKMKANNKLDERFNLLEKKLAKIEKDSVRNQLMNLIHDYPDRKDEIMEVAQHYFEDLKGNWYMTSMFKDWLEVEHIDKPSWIK